MLFISLQHCLYLLPLQVKMPRKMSPLHESAAPRAPKPMAPIAMPCSRYLNPGLMQMWVLEVAEEGNSGKCMPVTEEVGSLPHASMRIKVKALFFFQEPLSPTCAHHSLVRSQSVTYSVFPHLAGLPEEALRSPCVCAQWIWGFLCVLYG